MPCDPGRYCPSPGMRLDQLPFCSEGFICAEGAIVGMPRGPGDCLGECGPCPAGHYCELGSSRGIPCPPGTYMPFEGARTAQDCLPIEPGKFSKLSGLTDSADVGQNCFAGYICTGGSYSATPSSFQIGYQCDPGHYCEEGATHQKRCPLGMYQDETGSSSCKDCPSGKYCLRQGETSAKPCEPGFYCPRGSQIPTPCPRGTYSPNQGNAII